MKFIEILFQFHSSGSSKTKRKLKSVSIVRYAKRNCQQLCLFVGIERKKLQQWFRYNDILNFRMRSKRMKRQKKRIYCVRCSSISFYFCIQQTGFVQFIFATTQRQRRSFFSSFAKIKANILLATFNPTKQGIIECWQPIKKKTFYMHRSLFKCLLSMNTHGCFFSICTPSSQTF